MAATATRGREFVYVGWPVRSYWTMTPQREAGAVLPCRLYVEAADSERPVERLVVTLRLEVSYIPSQ